MSRAVVRLRFGLFAAWSLALAFAVVPGCDCSGDIGAGACTSSASCAAGVCIDGHCVADPTACTSSATCPSGTCLDGHCTALPPGCVDGDGDFYGEGCPRGPDCDDTDPLQTGVELCDGLDNDCDGVIDNGVLSACGDCDPTCLSAGIGVGTGTAFVPDGSTGDTAEGVGLDPSGALVLDSRAINTHIIWIANTGEGTVSKVDTDTFAELARYLTGPDGAGNDPSRTSVNSLGDVYVANRGGTSVTKISVLGAECADMNGDGVVTTSTGAGDIKAWGTDECVLWNVDFPEADLIRAAAAQDASGPDGEVIPYVWIGAYAAGDGSASGLVWKLDGTTGARVLQTQGPTYNYGFALDGTGNLWISGLGNQALGRIDTTRCIDTASCAVATCVGEGPGFDDCIKQQIPAPSGSYGITVDFHQRVWLAGYQGDNRIMRYDPAAAPGSRWGSVMTGFITFGITADASGWVWAAGTTDGVVRVNADTLEYQIVPGTAGIAYAKGMAVDQTGKIWTINQGGSNDATVIVPGAAIGDYTSVTPGVAATPAYRYTYSDMTGQQLRLATNPFGYYRHIFEGCAEGVATTEWRDLSWTADVPVGTSTRFRVRTAATRAELDAATWVIVANVPSDPSPADIRGELTRLGITPAHFLELEVRLESTRTSGTAVITPRVSAMDVSHLCVPIVG
jgi:hypothetical protein